jgi:hypothetical protein
LNRWKNYFYQLFNVDGVNDVRETEIHTAKPLSVPEPSAFNTEIIIGKLRRCKLPGIVQMLAELIQAVSNTLHFKIHKLVNSICNNEELPQQWKESITVPIFGKVDRTDYYL